MNRQDETWKPKPADRVVRRPRMAGILPIRMELPAPRVKAPAVSPPLILVYAFGLLIAVGTSLLMLPMAHHGDGLAPIVDALFTATSAATVTGLITVDTSSYWTVPGQAVIVVLMFGGGLGIMTLASALLVLAGQRASLTQRMVMGETIGTADFADIARLTLLLVIWAVAIQVAGFLVLLIGFVPIYPTAEAVWHALFQTVSGFNNAGFTSLPDSASLTGFQTDYLVVGTIGVLILLGSTGFWVTADFIRQGPFSRLSLNSKLVLFLTGVLIAAGALLFYAFESDNEATMGGMSAGDQAFTSVFQSVNRTSGFSTVDFGATNEETNSFYMILMFIGGAAASVAGGVKVNTVAIVVIAVAASIRGRTEPSAFGRRISEHQVQWAFALTALGLVAASTVALALAAIEDDLPLIDLLFESVSALGTVGFSAGITPDLSAAGKLLLVAAMFIGRIAPPMVIRAALSRRTEGRPFRYPSDNVLIG